jgi:hypothetical protein
MQFGANLKEKAFLALEEAVQEARHRPVRRSFALRFALAYLWSCGAGDKGPYRDFWRALARADLWRFSACDQALQDIYRSLGATRSDEVLMELWKRRQEEERRLR